MNFQGDLRSYLQKIGKLSPSKALTFALDIGRQVVFLTSVYVNQEKKGKLGFFYNIILITCPVVNF